jgi:hypothetical protein
MEDKNFIKYQLIYQQVNNKLAEQVREFYTITGILLSINGLLLPLFFSRFIVNNTGYRLCLSAVMLLVTLFWIGINFSYSKWKEAWIRQVKYCENKMFTKENDKAWTKVLDEAKSYKFGSISNYINNMVYVFIIFWLIVFLISIHNFYPIINSILRCSEF